MGGRQHRLIGKSSDLLTHWISCSSASLCLVPADRLADTGAKAGFDRDCVPPGIMPGAGADTTETSRTKYDPPPFLWSVKPNLGDTPDRGGRSFGEVRNPGLPGFSSCEVCRSVRAR